MYYIITITTISFRTAERACLEIEGHKIECVDEIKVLGVMIDSRLSWKPHIDYLRKKLNSAVFVIRSMKSLLNIQNLKSVYHALFHSLISYGVALWGSSTESIQIFRAQKWAIRVMVGETVRTSCRPYFKQLEILPLPSLFIHECICLIKKNENDMMRGSMVHFYETRRRHHLRDNHHRTTLFARGAKSCGINLYNALPEHLKILEFNKFRIELRKELLKFCFYSIQEFNEHFTGN